MKTEKIRLENVASKSLYTTFTNSATIEYCYRIYQRFLSTGSILEMGPAEGLMTRYLVNDTDDLTLVDGSEIFCNELKKNFPKAKVVNALFEEFVPTQKFDNILLGHVLEHVDDAGVILQRVKSWLKDDGVVLAAVPNSRSLHRQAAVIMGIQPTEDSMSELDYHHGHRRIYNPETFRSEFIRAGFKLHHYGGYWLKPISNSQIDQSWSSSLLEAYMQLGERYPDIAGEIYVVAKLS